MNIAQNVKMCGAQFAEGLTNPYFRTYEMVSGFSCPKLKIKIKTSWAFQFSKKISQSGRSSKVLGKLWSRGKVHKCPK